jgi:hypothetical protein
MVRQKRKKRRPTFGLPEGIVLLSTPEGWRHTILTVDGGMHCGYLTDVPASANPAEAQAAAAAVVVGLAQHFHETRVDVTWDLPREPGAWTAQITVATAPPNAAG